MDEAEMIKILEPCTLDKSSYTAICFDVMAKLSDKSYLVTDSESGDDKPILERNYVISMVFQMGRNTSDSNFGTNVFPSGENIKELNYTLEETKDTYKDLYKREPSDLQIVIPDLVIHTSHDPKAAQSNGQYVAVEVKTTKKLERTPFFKDFFKLNRYICDLRFKNAIYLIVNTPMNRIENLIKHYFDNHYFCKKNELGKLLFFIQENQKSTPATYKLTEDYIKTIKE